MGFQVEEPNMKEFDKIWNGEVGTVVEGSDWDEHHELIVINGNIFEEGSSTFEMDIDDFMFENGTEDLVLFRDDGYRGVGCYSGYMKLGDRHFSLDIINDYLVTEIFDSGIEASWRDGNGGV